MSDDLSAAADDLLDGAGVEIGPEQAEGAAEAGAETLEGQAAEGGESLGNSLFERAMSTEPNIPLDSPELDSLWDPENGGLRRVNRGLMKFGGFDGLPAVVDIPLGMIEEYVKRSNGGGGDTDRGEAGGFSAEDWEGQ